MYKCTVSGFAMATCPPNNQLDDDDQERGRIEAVSLSTLLFAGVGLLWFFGWLLTL